MLARHRFAASALLTVLVLGGCASTSGAPGNGGTANGDPFESVNRVVFDVNDFLDRLLLRPLAELYRITVPPPLRDRVAGIVKNMGEPVIFANNVLQWEWDRAKTTAGRFAVNTTLGLGGMFEVANEFDLQRQKGDFGQTLHSWGFKSGPYLVLPLFGPSNVRDAIGLGVDSAMSPWKYIVAYGSSSIEDKFLIADTLATALVRREENIEGLDALRQGSLDFYAQMRSVYRQHRAKVLGAPDVDEMPVFEDYDSGTIRPVVQ